MENSDPFVSDLYADLKDAESSVVIAESNASGDNTNLERIISEQDTLVANAKKTLLTEDIEAIAKDASTTAAAPIISGEYIGMEGQYAIRVYASSTKTGSSFEVSGLEKNFVGEVTVEQSVPLGSHGLYIRFPSATGYGNTEWIVDIQNKRGSTYTANNNAYQAALSARDRIVSEAQNDVTATIGIDSVVQAKIQQARAKVQGIQSQIAKRLITAPFDGIVADVAIEKGETSSATSTIKLISDTDYEVVAKVPELDIGKLSVGTRADIALDAYPGETFPGKIISINPAETIVDGVPVYEAKIIFDPLDPRVRSGMTAIATVKTASQPDVIAVPLRFIQTVNGETLAYIKTDVETKKQPVTLGLKGSDGFVEIVSGLALGDVISAPPAN